MVFDASNFNYTMNKRREREREKNELLFIQFVSFILYTEIINVATNCRIAAAYFGITSKDNH